MYKNQSVNRQIYAFLGGRFGVLALVIVIVVFIIATVLYIRKRKFEQQQDDNDFLRYLKLIKPYLRIKRENLNFTEQSVQYEMDRFQFSNILLPVGSVEQNLIWSTDSSTFGDLCNSLMGMLSYASDSKSKYYKNELLWKQILYAIRIIAAKLPDLPQQFTVPWGTNWYQFSITYPTFLVAAAFSYLDTFGEENTFLTRHLSSYIKNYFKESYNADGLLSMGWKRQESNVIGMSVPLIGGRLYANQFNRDANSQKYAREYMKADYVYENNGFYYDNTYITHISRNDGYTTSFYHEFKFIYDFYRMNTRFFRVLHRNFSITEHPDFGLHHGPWFSRGPSLKGFAPGRKYATYGLDIRGFERGICLRTKSVSLHYCGQIKPLAAYESDRINKEWGQCWIFMRRPITKDTAERMYTELVPYYDGVHSYGKIQINWPSITTTTTTFEPDNALCSLCCLTNKVAGMYNKFSIRMADQYNFDIEEINMVTPDALHVYYKCKVDANTAATNPYTIAIRLGYQEKNNNISLTGIGSKYSYAFDNFIGSFLYLDEIDQENADSVVKIDDIIDPATSKTMNALYVQPTSRQLFTFGFSNNFYNYGTTDRHNSLNALPTMNTLSTDKYKLIKDDTDDALLFLNNYVDKTAAISYAFNFKLPKGISIRKSVLDGKYTQYNVVNGIFDSHNGVYTVNTYEKQFQMLLTNVAFKQ